MTLDLWLALAIFLLDATVIIGIFSTKAPDFGRFSARILLLPFSYLSVGLIFAFGRIGASPFANVLFAVIGFAGGWPANRRAPCTLR